ncbi:hypothetical protein HWC14_gp03 [Serratia phage Parlo]|uniref:Uncharacterized protein n=1 Tax=Serratia phage Parlo TaxID=2557554 RepID=A0A482MG46_9CAUD|nr:hypothetical protein HWC14_gp03 [Serratia phage Parlo]QBQ72152.1 hypothetical protein CPT_Parlo_003 [Serratia phage Parlo]
MISPKANQVAAEMIAIREDIPPRRLFRFSPLVRKCAALIEADRFLRAVDVPPAPGGGHV